jgi:hypothetical protein
VVGPDVGGKHEPTVWPYLEQSGRAPPAGAAVPPLDEDAGIDELLDRIETVEGA